MTSYPQPFAFEGKEFYNMDEVRSHDPNFFYGCSQGIRTILKRKAIPQEAYTFASWVGGKWKTSQSSYPKAKLLVDRRWVEAHVPKLAVTPVEQAAKAGYQYQEAPPQLQLTEDEMFKDTEGKPIAIEVRGERQHDKCYFKVADVATGFEMPKLYDTIIDPRKEGYSERQDYVYFATMKGSVFGGKVVDKPAPTPKKELFLTYDGMLRVLYASHSPKAHAFRRWATERLFAVQMGTVDQKNRLVAELKGVSVDAVVSVFNASAVDYPCVYLIAIDKVSNVRAKYGIAASQPDDAVLYKFGKTNDLRRRMQEHASEKKYGRQIRLACHTYVDPLNVTDAETELKHILDGFDVRVDVHDHNELVALSPKQLTSVEKVCTNIGRSYGGRNTALLEQVAELRLRLELYEVKLQASLKNEETLRQLVQQKDETLQLYRRLHASP